MPNYERDINELIPAAEKEATQKVSLLGKESEVRPGVDGLPYKWSFWTEIYHAAMNRMAFEAGLRK